MKPEQVTMDEKIYPEQDAEELGEWYMRHLSTMTTEGLHAKSAIAAQLAWRDRERTALMAERDELRRALAAAEVALRMVQQRWTFHDQDHTHTWHDWVECQPVIAAALAAGQGQGKERE